MEEDQKIKHRHIAEVILFRIFVYQSVKSKIVTQIKQKGMQLKSLSAISYNAIRKFRSGKNIKLFYYVNHYFSYWFVPSFIFRIQLTNTLSEARKRNDFEYVMERVNYYNKMTLYANLPCDSLSLSTHKPRKQKVYFFDTYEHTRWFSSIFKWGYCPGDITYVPSYPSIVKSRPLYCDNTNSILMKLNKIRHFIYLDDKICYTDKKNMAVFRGKIAGKASRQDFIRKFLYSNICDCGDVSKDPSIPVEWKVPKKTLQEHLEYKFIMTLEGNDVASNLKWVMSSRSIAVMPRPNYETWFMEGKLIPNYHYIEIAPDFSDLKEKLSYYSEHVEEAMQIIKNANDYVSQFKDKKREKLISLLVLNKYFILTNQIQPPNQ